MALIVSNLNKLLTMKVFTFLNADKAKKTEHNRKKSMSFISE